MSERLELEAMNKPDGDFDVPNVGEVWVDGGDDDWVVERIVRPFTVREWQESRRLFEPMRPIIVLRRVDE